jgi:hypothetical protein
MILELKSPATYDMKAAVNSTFQKEDSHGRIVGSQGHQPQRFFPLPGVFVEKLYLALDN